MGAVKYPCPGEIFVFGITHFESLASKCTVEAKNTMKLQYVTSITSKFWSKQKNKD